MGDTSSAACSSGIGASSAWRIKEGDEVSTTTTASTRVSPRTWSSSSGTTSSAVLQREMRGEVIGDVVGVPSGKRCADGTNDLLRRIGVLTSHVFDQRAVTEGPEGNRHVIVQTDRAGAVLFGHDSAKFHGAVFGAEVGRMARAVGGVPVDVELGHQFMLR